MLGYVPDEIIYVCKPEQDYRVMNTDQAIRIYPASPVPEQAENKLSAARVWANSGGYVWNSDYTKIEKDAGYQIVEFAELNDPINSIRVVGYSHRSDGECAYQVVIKEKYLVDLREEEFLRAIMESGIHSAGYIDGVKLRWIMSHTQMRLVYQDSDIFNKAAIAGTRRFMTKIPTMQLQVGGVYATKNGHIDVYLGRKKMNNGRNGFMFLETRCKSEKVSNGWINNINPLAVWVELKSSYTHVEHIRTLSIRPTLLIALVTRAK